jgi:hypothetical protein
MGQEVSRLSHGVIMMKIAEGIAIGCFELGPCLARKPANLKVRLGSNQEPALPVLREFGMRTKRHTNGSLFERRSLPVGETADDAV